MRQASRNDLYGKAAPQRSGQDPMPGGLSPSTGAQRRSSFDALLQVSDSHLDAHALINRMLGIFSVNLDAPHIGNVSNLDAPWRRGRGGWSEAT